MENIFINPFSLINQVRVADIQRIDDGVRGVYAWYISIPEQVMRGCSTTSPIEFLNSFYSQLEDDRLKGERFVAGLKKREYPLDTGVPQITRYSEYVHERVNQVLPLFLPPLYVGKAVGKTSGYSIRTRILSELNDQYVGKRISRAIDRANLSALISIEDFFIRYIDVSSMLDLIHEADNDYSLETLANEIEVLVFAGFFPPLNTKKGN